MNRQVNGRDRDDQIIPTRPGRDLEESVGPWQTDGRVVQDADGHTIAIALREADARLMAAVPRLLALLWVQLDSGLIDPYFRKDAEAALRDAGRELPVKADIDGGNGHGPLVAQQQMLVASIAALGRERGLALARAMGTVWHRLGPADGEGYMVECLATEGDLAALRAVIGRWRPRAFFGGYSHGSN